MVTPYCSTVITHTEKERQIARQTGSGEVTDPISIVTRLFYEENPHLFKKNAELYCPDLTSISGNTGKNSSVYEQEIAALK